jgi:hypothetical protein
MTRIVTAALTMLVLAGCMSPEAARKWDQAGLGMRQAGAPARTMYYGNYGYPMAFCRQMLNGTVYCW